MITEGTVEKNKSTFRNCLQINNADEIYKNEDNLLRKSQTAYRVLRFLTKHMDEDNTLMCSYKVMEEALGVKRAALSNAVKLLKDEKYIDVKKFGTNNVYTISTNLYRKL